MAELHLARAGRSRATGAAHAAQRSVVREKFYSYYRGRPTPWVHAPSGPRARRSGSGIHHSAMKWRLAHALVTRHEVASLASVVEAKRPEVTIEEAGLTRSDAARTRRRLRSFEEDWNAPGMEAYDAL